MTEGYKKRKRGWNYLDEHMVMKSVRWGPKHLNVLERVDIKKHVSPRQRKKCLAFYH